MPNRIAVALPIPELAPVTTTTLSARPVPIVSFIYECIVTDFCHWRNSLLFLFHALYLPLVRYIDVEQPSQPLRFLSISDGGVEYDILLHRGIITHHLPKALSPKKAPQTRPGPLGWHSIYRAWLCVSGTGHCRIGRQTSPVTPGSLILTHPGQSYALPVDLKEPMYLHLLPFSMRSKDGRMLAIPFRRLLEIWSGETLPMQSGVIQLDRHRRRQFEQLFTHYSAFFSPDGVLRVFSAHRAIFDFFACLVETVFGYSQENHKSALLHVRITIEDRFDQPLSLAELARIAHLNPSYLSRAFKKAFGLAPITYQQQLRIEAAKKLLATTSLRIKDVAQLSGFASAYYFSRCFGKKEGISPTAYRQLVREKHES